MVCMNTLLAGPNNVFYVGNHDFKDKTGDVQTLFFYIVQMSKTRWLGGAGKEVCAK